MTREATLTSKKLVALEPAMVDAIRDFRFAQRIETESEAIRRLIEVGLRHEPPAEPETRRGDGASLSLPALLAKIIVATQFDQFENPDEEIRSLVAESIHDLLSRTVGTEPDDLAYSEKNIEGQLCRILGGADYLRQLQVWRAAKHSHGRKKGQPPPAPELPKT